MDSIARNSEQLGQFLRSRRARLDPVDYDLVVPKRRRIRGFRREDVAQIAGISPAYYTWIEQGRDVHVSAEVLEAISGALRLSPAEHTHLFRLCGFDVEEVINVERVESHPAISHLFRSSTASGACLILFDCWLNMLRVNDTARAVFDVAPDSWPEQNAVWQLFFKEASKTLWVDWEKEVRTRTGMLRQSAAKSPDSPDLLRLLEALNESPEFTTYWNEYEVRSCPAPEEYFSATPWELNHPRFGSLLFYRLGLMIPALNERFVGVLAPANFQTASKLRGIFTDGAALLSFV